MTDLSHSREKDKINPVVFYTSAGLILLFSLTTILFRDFSALWIGRTLDWVSKTFGWYYLLAATLYIVFVVCIACSRFGSVKLGARTIQTGIQPAELGGDAVCCRDRYRPDVLSP
ncbi:high-affinity choline transport protein (BCCT-family transporter) [Escherichia coli]|nr:high-affinity choline transport protein (BCCT-family transporter) [Escherichia coli]